MEGKLEDAGSFILLKKRIENLEHTVKYNYGVACADGQKLDRHLAEHGHVDCMAKPGTWVLVKSEPLAQVGDLIDKLRDDGVITVAMHGEQAKMFKDLETTPADALISTLRPLINHAGHSLDCEKGPGGPGGQCTCGLDEAKEILEKVK